MDTSIAGQRGSVPSRACTTRWDTTTTCATLMRSDGSSAGKASFGTHGTWAILERTERRSIARRWATSRNQKTVTGFVTTVVFWVSKRMNS